MNKRINILITGFSGFVGTNLIDYLKKNDSYDLYGLDLEGCNNENLKEVYNWSAFNLNRDFDVIIHLAGIAHDLKGDRTDDIYYEVNYGLTKKIFDYHCAKNSSDSKFIFMSSVKAVIDKLNIVLNEEHPNTPKTVYGKSKLKAEEYITSNNNNCNFYILRPCMIHGPNNKGNLNLLYKFVNKGLPNPLAKFKNKRSLLSIENYCFIVDSIIKKNIASGIYNLSDDTPLSINEIISIISEVLKKKNRSIAIPKTIIKTLAKLGDVLKLPVNSSTLDKLTENYIVSNKKIKENINCDLPENSKDGLKKTIESFIS